LLLVYAAMVIGDLAWMAAMSTFKTAARERAALGAGTVALHKMSAYYVFRQDHKTH
jgi:hypothetical protein